MGSFRGVIDFVARPTHSRTMGLLIVLILVGGVFLTVNVAQQQQEVRQRAATTLPPPSTCIQAGGQCIGSYPCNLGLVPSDLSCGTSGVCCVNVAPTPTPSCGKIGQSCCPQGQACVTGARCATDDNICELIPINPTPTSGPTPTPDPRCVPACNSNELCKQVNEGGIISYICVAPTPTSTPSCGALGEICCSGNNCDNASLKCAGDGFCELASATPTPVAGCALKIKGDSNCDGIINILDFNIWRDEFKKTSVTLTSDFDNSGDITILDFNIWRDGLKSSF